MADAEIRCLYCNYVDDLLDLRADQLLFLRWLVDRYRLNCVFFEGVCDEDIAQFWGAESVQTKKPPLSDLADIMHQLPRLVQKSAAYASKVPKWEKMIDAALQNGIYYDSVGRLLIERPYVQLLAPEERVPLEEAYAEITAGKEGGKARLREAIIVRQLLAHKGCSVIVLGAGHDLSQQIIEQSHGECEYVKVTPARFPAPPLRKVGGGWPLNGAGSR